VIAHTLRSTVAQEINGPDNTAALLTSKHPKRSMRLASISLALSTVLAVAATVLFTSPLDALQAGAPAPVDIVAVSDADGLVTVRWADVDDDRRRYFVVRWRDQRTGVTTYADYRLRSVEDAWARPGFTFDPSQDRHSYTLPPGTAATDVSVRYGAGSRRSLWSDWVPVSDGIPDWDLTWTNDELTASWLDGPHSEQVSRYVLWYRPVGDTGAGTFVNARLAQTITLPVDSPDYEVRLRVVYRHLGKTARSEWKTPATPPPQIEDLRELCEPGGDVYRKIGATAPYAEDRIPIESQVWFFPTEAGQSGESFGHAHLLTCAPHRVPEANGTAVITSRFMDLDLHIQAHLDSAVRQDGTPMDQPRPDLRVEVPRIELRGRTDNIRDVLVDRFELGDGLFLECEAGASCESTVHLRSGVEDFQSTIDPSTGHTVTVGPAVELFNSPRATATFNPNVPERDNRKRGFTSDGFKQLRIAAIHEVYLDGENVASKRAILRTPFDFAPTDAPIGAEEGWVNRTINYRENFTETSGWLIESSRDGAGGYATIGTTAPLPTQPLTGPTWTLPLRVEADPCTNNCAVERMPVTTYRGWIDPAFHAGTPCVIANDPNESGDPRWCLAFEGTVPAALANVDGGFEQPIDIDISGLSPGAHRLVLTVEQPMVDSETAILEPGWRSTLSGLLVVRFVVDG